VLYDFFKEKAKITFSYFKNIQGKYMIAEIEQPRNNNLLQTNRILFQKFREKYENMRVAKEYHKSV
jgi:hypothetical protein